MRAEERTLVTDTTMRDAHQSLIATRMRSIDMLAVAPHYARLLPQLLSLECWGGATFDVAMRFLKEDPWERLAALREAVPNILLQALLRGANGVGYRNYPDNVVRFFVRRAAAGGIDLFRVFDCLNWVDNMRLTMDVVREEGKLCEAAICYSGDLCDPHSKYDLGYYLRLARDLEAAGAHIIGIKDMAGLCKPEAARRLVRALKQEVGRAAALPHPRHEWDIRRERDRGRGGGLRCHRRRDGFLERTHLAAEPRSHRGSPFGAAGGIRDSSAMRCAA